MPPSAGGVRRSRRSRASSARAAATAARRSCRCSTRRRSRPIPRSSSATATSPRSTRSCSSSAASSASTGRCSRAASPTGPRYDRDSFVRAVSVAEPMGALVPPGLEIWRDGEASGVLVGGTITQLASSLGTPFAFDPPPGCVLFLDEVNERPYRLDRLLTQLMPGRAPSRAPPPSSSTSCPAATSPTARCAAPTPSAASSRISTGPIVAGFPSGHTPGRDDDAAVRRAARR